jgi:photosynthetic reaction center cytochrome c subunit
MRNSLVSMRAVLAALGLALAVTGLTAAQQAPQALDGKTAEQVYKNIQILQGTPADQLNPEMRLIAADLGVGCDFCHVDDRSKDDKDTKKTAREMMTMMFGINKASFNNRLQVTCYSCHRGSNNPVNVPAIPEPGATAQAAAKPTLPTADEILAKYVEALGGEQAIRKVTSRLIASTVDLPGAPGAGGTPVHASAQHYFRAPDLNVLITQTPAGPTSTGYDGKSGWSQDAKGVVTESTGVALARAKRNSDFYQSLDLKQQYTRLAVRGIEKVRDHDAYMVQAVPQGDTAERLYFDTQSGLLLRKWTATPTTIGNNPLQTDYDDYRDPGDGVKTPYLIRIAGLSPAQGVTVHVEKVQDNVPIDNSKFDKPAPKAP